MTFDRERFAKDLIELAAKGVPFVHKTCNPEVGMDCVNVARWAYENQGLKLPERLVAEFEDYEEVPDGQKFLATMRKWFIEIPKDKADLSDLFVIYARKNPCHVAIKVSDDPLMVVEAYRSMDNHIRKVLHWPLDPKRKIATVFRFPEFV